MSYRCTYCRGHVTGPMRRHVTRKPTGDIASEAPACDDCIRRLRDGAPLAEAPKRAATAVEPEYEGPQFG